MTENSKLKAKIVEQGYQMTEFADAIGMSRPTFRNRMRGKTQFRISEVQTICARLGIKPEDMSAYFFTSFVPSQETSKEATR